MSGTRHTQYGVSSVHPLKPYMVDEEHLPIEAIVTSAYTGKSGKVKVKGEHMLLNKLRAMVRPAADFLFKVMLVI